MDIINVLAKEFNIREEYSKNLVNLLDEDATIPFIARYRKEMHGSLDDQVIRSFADRLTYLRNFEDRKQTIIKSIDEQGKLTDEIIKKLDGAKTLTELEDIYRPYKPKRKTRATEAIAKGLEPLADIIMKQDKDVKSLEEVATPFVDEERVLRLLKRLFKVLKILLLKELVMIVKQEKTFVSSCKNLHSLLL